MTPRAAFSKWALIGGIVATIFLVGQASSVGGVAGLLQVGEFSSLRPLIEDELGEIPLAPGNGHDGQIYYSIGLDLTGDQVPDLLDHGAYRYRRILYPFVSSLGGLLDGWTLLYGMIVVTTVSTAIATGSLAAMAVRGGRSEWLSLAVLLNPGVWLSIRLLTADASALAFMLLALLLLTTRRRNSIAAFTLSGLSKDVYLATPGGLALSRDRRRWPALLIPLSVLVAWMTWLTVTMGEGFTGRGNMSLPFLGIVDATANWANLHLEEWFYLAFALASVAAGLVAGLKGRSWLRWSILAWSGLGIIASNWVWDFGNNAARAFAPIVALIALSYVPAPTRDASPAPLTEDAASGR